MPRNNVYAALRRRGKRRQFMAEMMDTISYLAGEIGPRPAGSEEEQQAALYLEEQFKDAGLETEVEEFTDAISTSKTTIICSAVIVVVSILALITSILMIPALILSIICAVMMVLEDLNKPVASKVLDKGISQNVVAKYVPDAARGRSGRSRKIILVARYDSGNNHPELNGPLANALPIFEKGARISMLAIPVILLIKALFLLHSTSVIAILFNILLVVAIVFVALSLIAKLMQKGAGLNDGAVNNASGVAVLVETAKRVAEGAQAYGSGAGAAGDGAGYPVIHGAEEAYAQGVVPDGTQLSYEQSGLRSGQASGSYDISNQDSEEARLLAAKAAISALTGREVPQTISLSFGEDKPGVGAESDFAGSAAGVAGAAGAAYGMAGEGAAYGMAGTGAGMAGAGAAGVVAGAGAVAGAAFANAGAAAVESFGGTNYAGVTIQTRDAAGAADALAQENASQAQAAPVRASVNSGSFSDVPDWFKAARDAAAAKNGTTQTEQVEVHRSTFADALDRANAGSSQYAGGQRQSYYSQMQASQASDNEQSGAVNELVMNGYSPAEASSVAARLQEIQNAANAAQAPTYNKETLNDIDSVALQSLQAQQAQSGVAGATGATGVTVATDAAFAADTTGAQEQSNMMQDAPLQDNLPAAETSQTAAQQARKSLAGLSALFGDAETFNAQDGATVQPAQEQVTTTQAAAAQDVAQATATQTSQSSAQQSEVSSFAGGIFSELPQKTIAMPAASIAAGADAQASAAVVAGEGGTPSRPLITLPSLTGSMQAIGETKQRAPLAEAQESGGQAAAKSMLSMLPSISLGSTQDQAPQPFENAQSSEAPLNVPSISGFDAKVEPVTPEEDPMQFETQAFTALTGATVSIGAVRGNTGSFSAVTPGATGAFAPVSEALIQNADDEELIVTDVDDSVYAGQLTQTGAYAGPGYVDMPKSRGRGFFGRLFGKKNKEETNVNEWLDVDDNFDAQSAGARRGGWDSFRSDDDDVQTSASPWDDYEAPQDSTWNQSSDWDDEAYDYDAQNSTWNQKSSWDDDDDSFSSNARGGKRKRRSKRKDDFFFDEDEWNGGAFSKLQSLIPGKRGIENNNEDADVYSADEYAGYDQGMPADEVEAYSVRDDAASRIGGNRTNEGRGFEGHVNETYISENQPRASREINRDIRSFRAGDIKNEVWFVALGADYDGNCGLKQFLAAHAQELKGATIVELESLGAGDLCYAQSEGILRPNNVQSRMKRFISKAASSAGLHVDGVSLNWRESASSVAKNNGVPSLHLLGMDGIAPAFYGAANDAVSNVDEEKLNENADFVVELLRNM